MMKPNDTIQYAIGSFLSFIISLFGITIHAWITYIFLTLSCVCAGMMIYSLFKEYDIKTMKKKD